MVSVLAAALDAVSSVDDAALGPALGERIRDLIEARHRLDGLIERAVGAYDAAGYAELDGAKTTAAWLRGRTLMTPAEASARVKTARYLRDLPATAAALAAGEISFDHARAIAMLAADTDVDATRSVEAQLVEVAGLLDPVRFASELRSIRDNYKPQPKPNPHETAYERRRLSLNQSLEGSFSLGGWLTEEGGALVKTALDALAAPLPGDIRTPTQRYADALVELARRQLDGGELPADHGVAPHLVVVAEVEDPSRDAEDDAGGDDLQGRGDGAGPGPAPDRGGGDCGRDGCGPRRGATGDHGASSAPQPGRGLRLVRGRLVGGGTLSSETLARLGCDATVSRLLIKPPGEVLDLGRAQRVVTRAQWTALVLRDGGCVAPGHDCRPSGCQAHHLTSWLDGGSTDLSNLALICTYVHRLVHEGGFRLYLREDDQRWVLVRPDGTELEGDVIGQTGRGAAAIAVALARGPRGPTER